MPLYGGFRQVSVRFHSGNTLFYRFIGEKEKTMSLFGVSINFLSTEKITEWREKERETETETESREE